MNPFELSDYSTQFTKSIGAKDGNMSFSAFLDFLKEMGWSDEICNKDGVLAWFKEIGIEKTPSDSISKKEMTRVISKRGQAERTVASIARKFKQQDTDGDGKVTREEYVSFLQKMGRTVSEDYVDRVFGGKDTNGDGVLELSELIRRHMDQS